MPQGPQVLVSPQAQAQKPRVSCDLKLLADWLKEPDVPTRWLIDGWMKWGTRVLAYAQFKAGKTTFIANMARSLADGDPFLGEATVMPLQDGETLVLLDFEMGRAQLKEWLAIQNIVHADRVAVAAMRGFATHFNLLDSRCRQDWAQLLQGQNCKFLIIDCIGPVMSASDLLEGDNSQTSKFLRLVDELLVAGGVDNCLLVHHMGHDERRPRGASAFRGWCDTEITLRRTGNLSTGQRYISAVGRDVSQPERELQYDEATHRFAIGKPVLFTSSGGRKVKSADAALGEVVKLLRVTPGLNATRVVQQIRGGGASYSDSTIRKALKTGVAQGVLSESGPSNNTVFRLTTP
jgi:hypothetical protein